MQVPHEMSVRRGLARGQAPRARRDATLRAVRLLRVGIALGFVIGVSSYAACGSASDPSIPAVPDSSLPDAPLPDDALEAKRIACDFQAGALPTETLGGI